MKYLLLLTIALLSGCSLFNQIDLNDPAYNKTGTVEYLTTVEAIKITEVEPFTFAVTNDANEMIFRRDKINYVNWSPKVSGLYTVTVYYKTKQPNIIVIYNPPQKDQEKYQYKD